MTKSSIAADAACAFGLLALLTVLLGPAAVHLGFFSPIRGFVVFVFGLVPCAPLALIFGILGILRPPPALGPPGRGRARVGTCIGLALLLLAGILIFQARRAPPIHDITTDMSSPPEFSEAVRTLRTGYNGVDYPDGGLSATELQEKAYPDLLPVKLDAPTDTALDRARRAAEQLGWKITRMDPTERRIEAYDVTRFFMFIDDIVIRVSPSGAGSVVDIRSNSRTGRADLGRNAARIRAFRAALLRN